MTPNELHILEHATAWRNGRYRNHYVAGPEQDVWPTLLSLCERGLLRVSRGPDGDLGGMSVFQVTDAGFVALDWGKVL